MSYITGSSLMPFAIQSHRHRPRRFFEFHDETMCYTWMENTMGRAIRHLDEELTFAAHTRYQVHNLVQEIASK